MDFAIGRLWNVVYTGKSVISRGRGSRDQPKTKEKKEHNVQYLRSIPVYYTEFQAKCNTTINSTIHASLARSMRATRLPTYSP